MHFLQHLLRWMLPVQVMLVQGDEEPPPPGFSFVVTNTGSYVTIANGDRVIAKN